MVCVLRKMSGDGRSFLVVCCFFPGGIPSLHNPLLQKSYHSGMIVKPH